VKVSSGVREENACGGGRASFTGPVNWRKVVQISIASKGGNFERIGGNEAIKRGWEEKLSSKGAAWIGIKIVKMQACKHRWRAEVRRMAKKLRQ